MASFQIIWHYIKFSNMVYYICSIDIFWCSQIVAHQIFCNVDLHLKCICYIYTCNISKYTKIDFKQYFFNWIDLIKLYSNWRYISSVSIKVLLFLMRSNTNLHEILSMWKKNLNPCMLCIWIITPSEMDLKKIEKVGFLVYLCTYRCANRHSTLLMYTSSRSYVASYNLT